MKSSKSSLGGDYWRTGVDLWVDWFIQAQRAKERDFHESLAVEAGSDEDIDLDFDSSELDEADDEDHSPARKPEAEDPLAEADVYIAYGRLGQQLMYWKTASLKNLVGLTSCEAFEVYKQLGILRPSKNNLMKLMRWDDRLWLRLKVCENDFAELSEPISIDDLENELLSGKSSSKTVQYKAPERRLIKIEEEDNAGKGCACIVEPELDFGLDEEDLALDSSRNELDDDLGWIWTLTSWSPPLWISTVWKDQADNAIELDDEALSLMRQVEPGRSRCSKTMAMCLPSWMKSLPENKLSSLDLDSEEESLDLQSMKEELEEVSSVLADTESALDDLDEMDDIDDLDLDADLSLEDLDAELDAEMDSVDETIEHEEESVESDELDIESDFDEEDDNDLSATIIFLVKRKIRLSMQKN